MAGGGEADFADAASLSPILPASRWWAAATGWTVLAAAEGASRRGAGPGRRARVAGGAATGLDPEPVSVRAGWHADRVASGRRDPAAGAGSGVPRPILQGLKQLFDPAGASADASWLEQDAHA